MVQTHSPLHRKPPVRPPPAVRSTKARSQAASPPCAAAPAETAPQPLVRSSQTGPVTVPELAVPAPQHRIYLRYDLAQVPPMGPLRPRPQLLLHFLKALLPQPVLVTANGPAEKVEAFFGRMDQAPLGRVQAQACRRRPRAQQREHRWGFFLGPAQHSEAVRIPHQPPAPPFQFVVLRVALELRQQRTDHSPWQGAPLRQRLALQFRPQPSLQAWLPASSGRCPPPSVPAPTPSADRGEGGRSRSSDRHPRTRRGPGATALPRTPPSPHRRGQLQTRSCLGQSRARRGRA